MINDIFCICVCRWRYAGPVLSRTRFRWSMDSHPDFLPFWYFFLCYSQHFSVLFFPSLCHHSIPQEHFGVLKKLITYEMQMRWSEMNLSCDPDQIFIFHLCSPLSVRSSDWYGLFSFWWMSPGNLLWRWNGELSVFLFHSYCSSWCILTHKSTFHPLGLCCSWHGCECDMNLIGFVI